MSRFFFRCKDLDFIGAKGCLTPSHPQIYANVLRSGHKLSQNRSY